MSRMKTQRLPVLSRKGAMTLLLIGEFHVDLVMLSFIVVMGCDCRFVIIITTTTTVVFDELWLEEDMPHWYIVVFVIIDGMERPWRTGWPTAETSHDDILPNRISGWLVGTLITWCVVTKNGRLWEKLDQSAPIRLVVYTLLVCIQQFLEQALQGPVACFVGTASPFLMSFGSRWCFFSSTLLL